MSKITFKWSDDKGEGYISRADKTRLLELAKTDWVTAADFMVDVVFEAQELYNEVMGALAHANEEQMTDDNFQNLPLNESFEHVAKVTEERADFNKQMALREALIDLLHAVCGKTGFAEAVRRDSGRIYPWPALELAEAKALAALEQSK